MKSLSRDPKSFNMELLTVALQFKGPGVKSLASAEKKQEIAMLNFHKDITCSNRCVQCGSLFEGRGCKSFSLLTHLSDVNKICGWNTNHSISEMWPEFLLANQCVWGFRGTRVPL